MKIVNLKYCLSFWNITWNLFLLNGNILAHFIKSNFQIDIERTVMGKESWNHKFKI